MAIRAPDGANNGADGADDDNHWDGKVKVNQTMTMLMMVLMMMAMIITGMAM